jgi:hypothetical protein
MSNNFSNVKDLFDRNPKPGVHIDIFNAPAPQPKPAPDRSADSPLFVPECPALKK